MSNGALVAAMLVAASVPFTPLGAQGLPSGIVGWYNGDWKPGIAAVVNWHASDTQYAHLYDDFVVPEGGWNVTGVFAHVHLRTAAVQDAYWEIRGGLSSAGGSWLVASGVKAATMTKIGTVGNGLDAYLLSVTGITASLPPGHYWLCVAPVIADARSYLGATLGTGAVGDPKGTNGEAYLSDPPGEFFRKIQATGAAGTSGDFSLGVVISGVGFTRDSAWRLNFNLLSGSMLALHSRPFPGVSVDAFAARAEELGGKAASLSDAEIRTELERLVASVGDPHSNVIWPTPRPFKTLPLQLYWFDEGVYVIGAPSRYQALLGGKVEWIGKAGIDDAIAKLTPLAAHDNDSWLRYLMPSKLINTDFLYGTKIADSTAGVEIQVRSVPGELRSLQVDASDQAAQMIPAYQGPLPLYRSHPEKAYWTEVIEDGATVYVQYNSCREDPAQPSTEFFAAVDRMLASDQVRRVIIDLRNNTGGTTAPMTPWFERLTVSRVNRPGALYVIVGKATYSAAQAHANLFRELTAATFVGEPTGGKPRFLIRCGDFALPFYGLRVSYSNGTWPSNDPGPTLMPDIRVPVTFADYMKGADPALDAILQSWRRPRK